LIDLHLHTTASDGLLPPSVLVSRAAECGLHTISVTDHDTCAGIPEAGAEAERRGIRLICGVEITAVEDSRDVHMLAYFVDPESAALAAFLRGQRAQRVERIRQIGTRLADLGYLVDSEALASMMLGGGGRTVGRPQIADALVAAGHARDRDDAFERLLAAGRPAFVPRRGPAPEAVLAVVREAGGIVSMAHPGLTAMDHLIPRLAAGGLQALEVRHSDHDRATEDRYRGLAAEHGLAVSGGSDFHGDAGHRASSLGRVTLPPSDFATLEARRP
jgi:predicted metal-dependent phosphoesterase TrpH